MGLDMYLTKKYYVKNWDHNPDKYEVSVVRYMKDDPQRVKIATTISTDDVEYIECGVARWRKANAIHNWFVQNVQNGEDDCKSYCVSGDSLQELLDIVEQILADHSKAKAMLPSVDGFFFGGTDYDEYYYEDLDYTKEILTKVLATEEDAIVEYYYSSSW